MIGRLTDEQLDALADKLLCVQVSAAKKYGSAYTGPFDDFFWRDIARRTLDVVFEAVHGSKE